MARWNTQMAHPITAGFEENRAKALELRIAGNSFAQIAKELGVGISTAHRYVTESIDELREHSRDLAEESRRIEIARLDELVRTLWPKRENKGIADTIVKIGERRSKLLGLDAPVDMRFAGIPGGMPIPSGPSLDVTKMSLGELQTLEDFYDRYGARPAEEPKELVARTTPLQEPPNTYELRDPALAEHDPDIEEDQRRG